MSLLIFEKDYINAKDYFKERIKSRFDNVYLEGNHLIGNLKLDINEVLNNLSDEADCIYYLYEEGFNHFKEVLRIKKFKICIETKDSLDVILTKKIKKILDV